MCNCRSHYLQTGSVKEVIALATEGAYLGYSKNSASIDACIYNTLRHLWRNGITTYGSCCGHNKEPPNVIVHNSLTDTEARTIKKLIAQVDSRDFKVLSWKPVKWELVEC